MESGDVCLMPELNIRMNDDIKLKLLAVPQLVR